MSSEDTGELVRRIRELEARVRSLEARPLANSETVFASSFPLDHFNKPTLDSAWSWQGSPFSGTPGFVSLASRPSYLSVYNATIAGPFYLSRAASFVSGNQISARFLPTVDTVAGIRLDDGTDNNYSEARIENAGTTQGLKRIVHRYRVGGGAVTTTVKIDEIPSHPISLGLVWSSTPATFGFYSYEPHDCNINAGGWTYFGNLAAISTPSRCGIIHSNVSFTGSTNRRTLVDWFHFQ